MFTLRTPPYVKRIPTPIRTVEGVQSYDRDNLYPQRAEEVKNRSYTVKSAVQKLSEFIHGQGFINEDFAKMPLSCDGQWSNKVLKSTSLDYATFDGFALHIRYNLNYKINAITQIPFKYCRLGIPDEEGFVNDIKWSDNWEQDSEKTRKTQRVIKSFPIYDPTNIKEEFEEFGLDHPGQILYFSRDMGTYPLATFDAVFDSAQTQADISLYELSNIQEGFVGTTVFKYPGKIEEGEEEKIKEKISGHKGAAGKRIIVTEFDRDNDINIFESVSLPNVDKMFEFTSKNVKNAIRENFQMPAEILGVLPDTGIFNQEQLQEAFKYYNSVTKSKRLDIEEIFSNLMNNWYREGEYSTEIAKLTYDSNND